MRWNVKTFNEKSTRKQNQVWLNWQQSEAQVKTPPPGRPLLLPQCFLGTPNQPGQAMSVDEYQQTSLAPAPATPHSTAGQSKAQHAGWWRVSFPCNSSEFSPLSSDDEELLLHRDLQPQHPPHFRECEACRPETSPGAHCPPTAASPWWARLPLILKLIRSKQVW